MQCENHTGCFSARLKDFFREAQIGEYVREIIFQPAWEKVVSLQNFDGSTAWLLR
jgi:hypothetical protein